MNFENNLESSLDATASWVQYGSAHWPTTNAACELAAAHANKLPWEQVRLRIFGDFTPEPKAVLMLADRTKLEIDADFMDRNGKLLDFAKAKDGIWVPVCDLQQYESGNRKFFKNSYSQEFESADNLGTPNTRGLK